MERFFTLSSSVIAIRSKYYVSELCRRLGVDRVSQILPALAGMSTTESKMNYSKFRADLYRYKVGENIKNERLIRTIDRLLPGTARIIYHPIWQLLSTQAIEEVGLIALAQELEPGLPPLLLKYDEFARVIYFRSFSKDRNWFCPGSKFLRIIDRRSLDDLSALLIATKLHELHGEYSVSRLLRELVRYFFVEISLMPEFDGIIEGLYKEVCGVLAEIPCGGKCDGEVCLMLAQVLAAEAPERMLEVIQRVSAGRANRDGVYSEILRCNRAGECASGD